MHSSAVSIVASSLSSLLSSSLHLLFVTLALRVWIPSDPAFSFPWLSLSIKKTREALVILLSIRLLRRKEVIQYKCMMYWMLWEIIWFSSHILCSFFHSVVVALDSCFMLLHLILLMISCSFHTNSFIDFFMPLDAWFLRFRRLFVAFSLLLFVERDRVLLSLHWSWMLFPFTLTALTPGVSFLSWQLLIPCTLFPLPIYDKWQNIQEKEKKESDFDDNEK